MTEIRIIPESIELVKMTDAEYFSEKYRDYVSNSRLSLINPDEGGSGERYDQKNTSSFSESYELGSAVHNMILQNNSYFISQCDKPTGKLGLWAETVFQLRNNSETTPTIEEAMKLASIKSDYYSNQFTDKRIKTAMKGSIKYYLDRIKTVEVIEDKVPIYLSKPVKDKYMLIMENITASKTLLNKLMPKGMVSDPDYFNEYAILATLEVKIDGKVYLLKVKGKLDNFTLDHEFCEIILNDLKTSGKPLNYFMGNNVKVLDEDGKLEKTVWMDGSFQKYHYFRQMSMYLFLLMAAVKQYYGFNYKPKVNMLVVETIPNFNSKVFVVNGNYIKAGFEEFKKLITLVVEWETKKQLN